MKKSKIKKRLLYFIKKYKHNLFKKNSKSGKKIKNITYEIEMITKFLNDKNPKFSERVYCVINDICYIPICKNENCNYEVLFHCFSVGYNQYCSKKCKANSLINKDKIKQTNLIKYGVENVYQAIEIKEKIKQISLKKYGTEYISQYVGVKEKVKKTCLERFGVDNPLKSDVVKEKTKQTNLKRYGVEYNSQNIEIFKKQHKCQFKPYKLPSGKIVNVQGYENKYLDEYFKNNGQENNICIDYHSIKEKIGIIMYFNNDDNKNHRYYPDFYLINENKIIEVKSTYTYKRHIKINSLKMDACIKKGLNFEYKIY